MKTFNKLFRGDRVIWMVAALLALISLLAVYSATGTYANARYDGNNAYVLMRHAITLLLGLVFMYIVYRVKYTYYSRIFQILFWLSIPLLLYTLIFGANLNDAQRVIHIFGISFQSSDFAKIALTGYIARMLTIKQGEIKDFKNAFVPLMLPVLIIVGLIFPENFSTAALLFLSSLVLLFVGRINMKYLFIFLGIGILVMGLYIFIALNVSKDKGRSVTWINRIENFISHDNEINVEGDNFQVMHSKIAIAGGGIFGKAPGRSTQRNVLPHPYSDFIFAIIVEEYGLIGGTLVILLYMILLYRATVIMVRIPQSFGGFLSFGLAFNLVLQAMINMGVAVGMLPVTGQPMPFISMGGTSILFTGISIGMILSVSKEIGKIDEKRNKFEIAQSDN